MLQLVAMIFAFALLPSQPLFACSAHDFARAVARPTVSTIVFNLGFITFVSTALGLYGGITARRLAPGFKKFVLLLAVVHLSGIAGMRSAEACHGRETVAPVLEKVYAAEAKYYKLHGVYAASFDELGFAPESDQYSFFLPSQSLPAKNVSPRPGIDLAGLPEGVSASASARSFTVVAIAFAEPKRIDVWTMDEKDNFHEWSVPAERPLAQEPSTVRSTIPGDGVAWIIEQFEGSLILAAIILGLALGLSLSFALARRPAALPSST
jgi:hypothetical protein